MEHHESAANLLYEAIHAFLAPALYTRSLHTWVMLVPYLNDSSISQTTLPSEDNPNIRNGE